MTKFKASTRKDLPQIAEKLKLEKEQILDMQAVSAVLPFRVNDYVVENLIDPSDVPDDPIFQLTISSAQHAVGDGLPAHARPRCARHIRDGDQARRR